MILNKSLIGIHHIIFICSLVLIGGWYIPLTILSGFLFTRIIAEEILHKGISHRKYKRHNILDWFYCFCAVLLGQGSTIGWSNIHRQHHANTDTDQDPQSIFHNTFLSVYGGVFYPKKKFMAKDLIRSKAHLFTHKHYNTLHIAICLLLLLFEPLFLSFVSAGIVYSFHALGITNTLGHTGWNSWIGRVVGFTRESHDYHHQFPQSDKYRIF